MLVALAKRTDFILLPPPLFIQALLNSFILICGDQRPLCHLVDIHIM